MVFVHSLFPILILGFFCPFFREWGYVAINALIHCIYEGSNNAVFRPIWVEFSCENQNEWNNGRIMMYNYGVDHKELCGQYFVLRQSYMILPSCLLNS